MSRLRDAFARFEQIQFPGFPDDPVLQEAYDELVEKGGLLTNAIQQALTGGDADPDAIPTFEVDLGPAAGDPDAAEFVNYRAEVDALIELLREHLSAS